MRKMTLIVALASLAACGRATAQQAAVADVFERVRSSVVELRTVDVQSTTEDGRAVTARGIGSGVLLADGRILTAAHVVNMSGAIRVLFSDGSVTSARVVGQDRTADVALLRYAGQLPADVAPAALGDSDLARIGEQVFVVGAPLGLSNTLSVGHLSARRPGKSTLPDIVDATLLQTDAAINQGNSGGPMFNMAGEVIGVVSHLVTRTGGNSGLGFAVSSNTARELLLERPAFWSGSEATLVTGDVARALNTPGGRPGLVVERIVPGSPADRIGLRAGTLEARVGDRDMLLGGDIVLSIMGIDVGPEANHEQIRIALGALSAGDEITIDVLRAGRVETLTGRRGAE